MPHLAHCSQNIKILVVTSGIIFSACSQNSGGGSSSPKPAPTTGDAAPTPMPPPNPCTDPNAPGCNQISMIDQCWQKILNPPERQTCEQSGLVWNPVKRVCGPKNVKLKTPCTMADVNTALTAQGFAQADIDAQVNLISQRFTTALGTQTTAEIFECGEISEPSSGTAPTFLMPIFLGKVYSGPDDGYGTYKIQAGKNM